MSLDYQPQDAVLVQWRGDWYPARIIAIDGVRYKVRYEDSEEFWDEWVPADRIRPVAPSSSAPVTSSSPKVDDSQLPPGSTATSAYRPGDAVSVKWSGGWFPGRILRTEGGRYFVSYDGYPESSHEWVNADRLQRPGSPIASSPTTTPPPSPPVWTPSTAPTPAPTTAGGLQGTWHYKSWKANGSQELMNGSVFYTLGLQADGKWVLRNTTRSNPTFPETVAWGTYTSSSGTLVLTQTGTPARVYGRYAMEVSGQRMVLREAGTGDVIVVERR